MRTEDQITSMAPIEAVLGTTRYQVKLLSVVPQGNWRRNLADKMQPILATFDGDLTNISFANAYGVALRQSPEVFLELIFSYAQELPREEITASATEEQLAKLFLDILDVAFPFVKPLEMVTRLTTNPSR